MRAMRARNSKYLIARVSFWEGNQRIKNIARAENVLKMKNNTRFLRKVFISSSKTSLKQLKDQYCEIEEHRRT